MAGSTGIMWGRHAIRISQNEDLICVLVVYSQPVLRKVCNIMSPMVALSNQS